MFTKHCLHCPHKDECFDDGKCYRELFENRYNNLQINLSEVSEFSEMTDWEEYDFPRNDEPKDDPFDPD